MTRATGYVIFVEAKIPKSDKRTDS